jgi:hypothetical protein
MSRADRRGAGALHHRELPGDRGPADGPAPRARCCCTWRHPEHHHRARRVDRRQPLAAAAHGRDCPGRRGGWIDRELDILPTRPQDRFNTTPAQIGELREEIFPYWRGKTLEDIVAQRVPDDVRVAVKGRAFSLNQTDHAQGHILPDVEAWLRLGIGGLRRQVLAAQQEYEAHAKTQRRKDAQRENDSAPEDSLRCLCVSAPLRQIKPTDAWSSMTQR